MNKLLEYLTTNRHQLRINSVYGSYDELEFRISTLEDHHVAARLNTEYINNNEAIDEFCEELIYKAERYFKGK